MKSDQRRQIPRQSDTQQRDPRSTTRNAEPGRKATGFAFFLLVLFALAFAGCIGPVALHQAVLGYDKTVHRLETEMLLLNIARIHHNLPDHYTVTSAIVATFDYRTNVGFGDSHGCFRGRDPDHHRQVETDLRSARIGALAKRYPYGN